MLFAMNLESRVRTAAMTNSVSSLVGGHPQRKLFDELEELLSAKRT